MFWELALHYLAESLLALGAGKFTIGGCIKTESG